MKKLLSLLLCFIPFLNGCGSIYSNYRELEQIKVIQTMGLDYIPSGVQLTLSSASGGSGDGNALCLSGTGSSISEAMEQIRNYSCEDDLFFSHINQIIIGEDAARQGIDKYLNFICHSPEIRIDTPLYVVKDKTAKDTMGKVGSGTKGVSEILQAVETNEHEHNNSKIISTAQVINNLQKYGGALVCALEYSEAAENAKDGKENSENPDMTAALSGYGVFNGTELCAYIDSENAVGVDLLLNRLGISDIVVADKKGRPVTLETTGGKCRIVPVWGEDGELSGIDIFAQVSATILEMEEDNSMSKEEIADYMISKLESEISSRAGYVLQLSRKLQTDFLGLAGCIELDSPQKFRAMKTDFTDRLPALELRISVSGELCHTNDKR